ncbi:hypothetical protein [Actinokineospora bangkokensis]|uniref:Uncharacterized protein n=1 Tax=Actinokineospora bangkokensis TaxID=1193682 RepID=A0A1Q9LKC8_9PSEU|nr:hypothetical protein [Actinokineospora bangkokensis]OLR92439.1 hypothetical protein BJP25_20370 [Actinokineospora bangkokensis]
MPSSRSRFLAPLALAALLPIGLAAPASAAAERGYDCLVAQVSSSLFTAQYCQPRGGAPTSGVVTGSFTVTALVFDGRPGTAACEAPVPLTGVSAVATEDAQGTQVVALKCVRTS